MQHMAAPNERQAQGRSSSPGRGGFQPSTASASAVSMPLECVNDQSAISPHVHASGCHHVSMQLFHATGHGGAASNCISAVGACVQLGML